MAGKNGGARPGAGRPPGSKSHTTISKEQGREIVRQMVMARLEPMLDAQVAHAQGLKYLVIRDAKTGKFTKITKERMDELLETGDADLERLEIWEKEPSVQAWTDLANRALDKPKEQAQEINLTVELAAVSDRLLNARKRRALKSKNP